MKKTIFFCFRNDEEKLLDWRGTPNRPYYPSKENYRVEGCNNYDFREFPLNTINTKVSYDKEEILRYVNLSFNEGVIKSGLSKFFEKQDTLISITHPHEILPKFFTDSQLKKHPLLSFSLHQHPGTECYRQNFV